MRVSTIMESGLVLSHATADAAPRPFCTACWSGLQLGSRPGEWGLRFERLPELCACTLLPSSHRVRCPEHDMKLLTRGRGAQGGSKGRVSGPRRMLSFTFVHIITHVYMYADAPYISIAHVLFLCFSCAVPLLFPCVSFAFPFLFLCWPFVFPMLFL